MILFCQYFGIKICTVVKAFSLYCYNILRSLIMKYKESKKSRTKLIFALVSEIQSFQKMSPMRACSFSSSKTLKRVLTRSCGFVGSVFILRNPRQLLTIISRSRSSTAGAFLARRYLGNIHKERPHSQIFR